jgi:hypothetical protein
MALVLCCRLLDLNTLTGTLPSQLGVLPLSYLCVMACSISMLCFGLMFICVHLSSHSSAYAYAYAYAFYQYMVVCMSVYLSFNACLSICLTASLGATCDHLQRCIKQRRTGRKHSFRDLAIAGCITVSASCCRYPSIAPKLQHANWLQSIVGCPCSGGLVLKRRARSREGFTFLEKDSPF